MAILTSHIVQLYQNWNWPEVELKLRSLLLASSFVDSTTTRAQWRRMFDAQPWGGDFQLEEAQVRKKIILPVSTTCCCFTSRHLQNNALFGPRNESKYCNILGAENQWARLLIFISSSSAPQSLTIAWFQCLSVCAHSLSLSLPLPAFVLRCLSKLDRSIRFSGSIQHHRLANRETNIISPLCKAANWHATIGSVTFSTRATLFSVSMLSFHVKFGSVCSKKLLVVVGFGEEDLEEDASL